MLIEREWISRLNLRKPWEEVVEVSKDYLFVIDQTEKNGHYSGTIIKKSSDDNYILNHKIEYTLSGKAKCKCDIPVYYVHKDNIIVEDESTVTEGNGRLSNAGWEYYTDKMNDLCKDDPGGAENMRTAIWFVRMEMKQRRRTIEEALDNTSKKYKIGPGLLYSRFQSNLSVWRWAKKK